MDMPSVLRSEDSPQGKHTKILMITGPGEADARSSYEAGASDFIAKPAAAFSHRVMHILRDVCSQEELHGTRDMHREIVDASPHLLLRIGQDGTILDRRSPESFNSGFLPMHCRGAESVRFSSGKRQVLRIDISNRCSIPGGPDP